MNFPKPRMRLLAAFVLSLGLAACGGGGGNDSVADPVNGDPIADPAIPPSVISTVPVDGAIGVDPLTQIRFVMDQPIDDDSFASDSVLLTSPDVAAPLAAPRVFVDGATIIVTPTNPLPRGARIDVRLVEGILDTDGDALLADFAFSFDAEDFTEVQAQAHEQETEKARANALKLGANGNGMSVFRVDGSDLFYHRIVDGRPTGTALPIIRGGASAVRQENLDIASNGDAQISWLSRENSRNVLRVKRWDSVSQTWANSLNLTPSVLSEVNEFRSEIDNFGGMVAWTLQSTSDNTKQAVFVGFPEAGGDMDEPRGLRLADARRRQLRLSRSGTTSVIAWSEADAFGGYRVAMVSHDRVTGFSQVQNPTAQGRNASIIDAEASSNGYRFVLYSTEDQADADKSTLQLSVAKPGESFGLPLSLFVGSSKLRGAKLVVNDLGVAAVLYGREDGQPGTWFRRYIPGGGFEDAIEITAAEEAPTGTGADQLDVDIDDVGNAYALVSHRGPRTFRQQVTAAVISRLAAPRLGILVDTAAQAPQFARRGNRAPAEHGCTAVLDAP